MDKALGIIIRKAPVYSNWEHPSAVIFTFTLIESEKIEINISNWNNGLYFLKYLGESKQQASNLSKNSCF